ncbi:Phytoene dehydrogenase-related protein [Ruminococcaceae bacterium YRB3002]|nr:Phytoene dehydrogenase-related protein [Ruminococcaceae bacterium YRB3002]
MAKIVIVGGGIAGLAAGIYALKAGYEAEIYEKNPVAGGECMGWNRKGYHIDNCIHWLTGTDPRTKLWEVWKTVGAIDENTEYADTNRFYSSRFEGREVSLWNDLQKTQEELIKAAPEDEEEIRKFIQYVEYAKSCVIPSDKPLDMMGIKDYIEMGKEMADMPKVMKEYGKISCGDLAMRFKSPVMQKLMTDYLPKEYTAYSLLVSYATMASGNGGIPIEGSLAMSMRIVKKFKEMGGVLHTNKPIKKIIITGKKAEGIELEDGTTVKADYVISAVDTSFLYGKLIDESYMPKDLKEAYRNRYAYPVTSGFQVAYAIDSDFSGEDTIFFDCEPLRIGTNQFTRMSVKSYGYDRTFAPEGKTVLQANVVQSDADYVFWSALTKDEYIKKKAELAEELTKRIVKEFPELQGRIELLDCWTPLTYNRYCNAFHGSYMGFVTTVGNKQMRFKGVVKGVDNLFVAGQWVMSPGGLPIAVVSGKFAVQRILKKEKRSIAI